ncbi:hypothetical protein GOV12_03900 [Candidatus Pacearchaeota archaeon]|nr:hypothetical protein [Candidatus Pacearchaeota archaeon]
MENQRYFQFRLRSLFAVITGAAIICSTYSCKKEREEADANKPRNSYVYHSYSCIDGVVKNFIDDDNDDFTDRVIVYNPDKTISEYKRGENGFSHHVEICGRPYGKFESEKVDSFSFWVPGMKDNPWFEGNSKTAKEGRRLRKFQNKVLSDKMKKKN